MNNDFQNKLFGYETPPPQGAWERIAGALDDDEGFARRLAVYEAEPPLAAWKRLDASLNEAATPAKVVPFLIRYKNPLRYIAAASIIAVALVTLTLTLRQTEAGSLAGTQEKLLSSPAQPKAGGDKLPLTVKTEAVAVIAKPVHSNEGKTCLPR